MVLIANM